MSFKGFAIFSYGVHFVLLCSAERNYFNNFGRGSPKKHFCEFILKSGHWPRRRCRLKVFLFLAMASILIQRSETILVILVEGNPRNISVKLF